MITVDGRLVLDQPAITASFEVSGTVSSVRVSPGQIVAKGEALATLDDAALKEALDDAQKQYALKKAGLAKDDDAPSAAKLDRAKRELAAAQAAYDKLKAGGGNPHEVEQALRSWNQDKNSLWTTQMSRDDICGLKPGSSTEEDFKLANLNLECKKKTIDVQLAEFKEQASHQAYLDAQKPATEAALAQAWVSVMQAKAALAALQRGSGATSKEVAALELAQAQVVVDRAQRDVGKAQLLSPCDCVVQHVGLSAGTLADGGIALLDLSTLIFQTAEVGEQEVVRIAPSQPVTVQLSVIKEAMTGTVSAILPLPSQSAGAPSRYTLNLAIYPPDGALLLAGMTGRATLALQPHDSAAASATPTMTVTHALTGTALAVKGVVTTSVPASTPGFAQPGRVTAVLARAGQAVKQGDILATIDDAALRDAVKDAQMALDLMIAKSRAPAGTTSREDIAAAQAALDAAQLNYDAVKAGATSSEIANVKRNLDAAWLSYLSAQISRDVECGTPEGLEAKQCKNEEASYGSAFESWVAALDSYNKVLEPPSPEALAQANEAIISAKEKLAEMRNPTSKSAQALIDAQIDQAKSALARAENALARAQLLSPCNCVVQQVNVAVDVLSPADAFVLVDLTRLQFAATLSEADLARVVIGQPMTIQLNAFSQPVAGSVKTVLAGPAGSENGNVRFTMLIDMAPSNHPLLPGMAGQAISATP